MNNTTSRRSFLHKSAVATTGLALLSTSALSALSTESPFDGYNPYSEDKTDLRTDMFGEHIRIKGVVFDSTGSHPLSDATIEVWHLSPQSKKFRHRAKMKSDSFGQYNFITDFPHKDTSKANKIYFKVSDANKVQFTELFVDRSGANITSKHWQENNQLGEKLLPSTDASLTTLTINFNLSL